MNSLKESSSTTKKSELLRHEFVISVKEIGTDYSYKHQVVWKNAIAFLLLHLLALWGAVRLLTGVASFKLLAWGLLVGYAGGEGITIGAHRYYTHKSFKAKPFLRATLVLLQTIAGQNSMFTWCRDHRLHHRYSDTDADPHNSKRGFFFSHMGWLMTKKHPHVIELGRLIDMSDLQADWMVVYQKKYYVYLYIVFAFLIPTWAAVHLIGETWMNAFLVSFVLRYVWSLHTTWLVNSAAHLYGTRPYDKNLQPVETWFVSMITLGEGWHNYHHAYPWDYKTAELSDRFNVSADIIKFLEKIGLAYDLKTASPELVRKRIMRTGDGTHYDLGTDEARACVTALGPLHPLNPTYNVTYPPPSMHVKTEGLPLFNEDDVLKLPTNEIKSSSTD
ncbi:fatty acid desaturase domain-containing protein [Phthorimaea operculella]|nr:fatty acid desaturase domain-containing protein [Phthorimaea operculella]